MPVQKVCRRGNSNASIGQAQVSHECDTVLIVLQEIRKLSRANVGDKQCMDHVLDLAYGRRGKLRRELLEVKPIISSISFLIAELVDSHTRLIPTNHSLTPS